MRQDGRRQETQSQDATSIRRCVLIRDLRSGVRCVRRTGRTERRVLFLLMFPDGKTTVMFAAGFTYGFHTQLIPIRQRTEREREYGRDRLGIEFVTGRVPLIPWMGLRFSPHVLTRIRLGNGRVRGQGQGTLKKHAPPWAVQQGGAGNWARGPRFLGPWRPRNEH